MTNSYRKPSDAIQPVRVSPIRLSRHFSSLKCNSVFKLPVLFLLCLSAFGQHAFADNDWLEPYTIEWKSPSKNASESMPCGGGDIGLNVWVENGDVLMYLARSGTFDELNGFPKLGRIRVHLTPNPFEEGAEFSQKLNLQKGCVEIVGDKFGTRASIVVWVDVHRPVVHLDISCSDKSEAVVTYENWRQETRALTTLEKDVCRSWSGAPKEAILDKDNVSFVADNNAILFYHQNRNSNTCFDLVVNQQGLDSIKSQLFNPLQNLIFGGLIKGRNMVADSLTTGIYASTPFRGWRLKSLKPATRHKAEIILYTANADSVYKWEDGLAKTLMEENATIKHAKRETQDWWEDFWDRSYVRINEDNDNVTSKPWQVGRNYQLFRYQLGCNAYGSYPTKFNGGLFTFDPEYTDPDKKATPDYRRWGGGSFTAQNQRLVYWPMLKNGDVDLMKAQFDFYLRNLKNAELRSEVYWGHKGAAFTEQMENFGLPVAFEYGWKRPKGFDAGVEYNNWIEYEWDTAFEFCLMILDANQYTGEDISAYIPLIESCLRFYDEHYQYLSKQRTPQALDADGHLVLYPGTACETYKMAYNSTTTISALQTVLNRLLELDSTYLTPESRTHWKEMLTRIPPISFREMNGHKVIAPAQSFERINNCELPQLYPVFPYGLYGIGKPGLDTARNTWNYGVERPDQKNFLSWHQDNIFCARLGLTEEAAELTVRKLADADRRFPTWWGPGHDWVPDHNWGGSGMIGVQEMLMQTDGTHIYLFPSWPKDWDVTFKLHAPYNTTVEATLKHGKVESLTVVPESRAKDVTVMLEQ